MKSVNCRILLYVNDGNAFGSMVNGIIIASPSYECGHISLPESTPWDSAAFKVKRNHLGIQQQRKDKTSSAAQSVIGIEDQSIKNYRDRSHYSRMQTFIGQCNGTEGIRNGLCHWAIN